MGTAPLRDSHLQDTQVQAKQERSCDQGTFLPKREASEGWELGTIMGNQGKQLGSPDCTCDILYPLRLPSPGSFHCP